MGIKDDPVVKRAFRVWVKQNLFFADKRNVEEFVLPDLISKEEAVVMPPEVEEKYREVSAKMVATIGNLTLKYRDMDPTVRDSALEAFRMKFAGIISELSTLANTPEAVVPGAGNPKVERAGTIVSERVSGGGKTLLFTDAPDFAQEVGQKLSLNFPARKHIVGLADRILVFQDGEVVKTYRRKQYKDKDGVKVPAREWKSFVMMNYIVTDEDVVTATLTKTYAIGQNLQAFTTVIHLDRDTWNSERMKQRTARAWRQGQSHSVEEYTLDAVYADPLNSLDSTLDQIRGFMQQMEEDMFDDVVMQSMTQGLGKEYFTMDRHESAFYEINRRLMELTLSPYLARKAQGA